MLLIEADGKALFAEYGIAVPPGVTVPRVSAGEGHAPRVIPGEGPWVVKAQVPVGGRGKAGGVVRCTTPSDIDATLHRLLGSRIKGHQVEACLIEQAVRGEERYLALMVDAASYGVRVIYSAHGGIEIEDSGAGAGELCTPDMDAIAATIARRIAGEPPGWRDALAALGRNLARLLLERDLMLVEINPLFVSPAGCVAGDAKVVVDLNAIDRQPGLAAMIAARPAIYADANRKLQEGFDYVELDPAGEIGLVTTGAGLSMMLIDELTARGAKPLNFCDIRTGQMRGSPARLMRVLEWITARPSLRAVLVNIFAGITDLAEFADLLATAVERTPSLRVPVVARLIGRNAEQAQRILAERQPGMLVTEDLEAAMAAVIAHQKLPLPLRASAAKRTKAGGRGRADNQESRDQRTTPPLIPPQGEREHLSPAPVTLLTTLSHRTPTIVQGITGRMGRTHAALMRAYGTNIAGGTSSRTDVAKAAGVPVFATCAEAVAATGAIASVIMAPPLETLAAMQEALAAGIRVAVTVAEGVPSHDALRIGRTAREAGAVWIGASTPGMAIPDTIKLGFLPDVTLRPGPFAIITKSGTLSYEVGYRLAREGLGQSIWIGVGGDAVKGVRFADLLPPLFAHEATAAIILVGEVGGTEEEEFADALQRLGLRKPVYALIAGREAKEGVAMGHAGALVHGDSGSLESKVRRLGNAGVVVCETIDSLVRTCVTDFQQHRI